MAEHEKLVIMAKLIRKGEAERVFAPDLPPLAKRMAEITSATSTLVYGATAAGRALAAVGNPHRRSRRCSP